MDPLTLGLGAAAFLGLGLTAGLFFLYSQQKRAAADAIARRDYLESALETAEDERAKAELSLIKAEAEAARSEKLAAELKTERDARSQVTAEFASLKATHEADARHHEVRMADLEKAQKELTEKFQLTADKVLKASGEELTKKGQQSLSALLNPLKEQLEGFQKKVHDDAEKRAGQTGQLHQLVEVVRADAERMSSDARNLANALRSSSKVQGDWGELVLSSILERAGLREGEEFHTQQSETAEDGSRLRPDVVVEMPNGHRLVIDSKVSLTAFERAVNADTEEDRAAAIKQHVASVKTHIKALGEKDYAQFYEGVSFTLMFVPLEGAASIALQTDPELTVFAAEQDVMIATPTTLMMAMRTVQNLWMIERQNQNAREIADRAGRLYDKFEGFVGDLEKIGRHIGQTQNAWEEAKKKLSSGAGNLVRQTEMLKKMGAKTKKSLPGEYLDAAGVEEAEAETPALPEPAAADS